MAIDSHLLHKPRPLRVFAGRIGVRSIIPYENFEPEALQEAVAILQGTSTHYRFAEDGTLEEIGKKALEPDSEPTGPTREEYEAADRASVTCMDAMEDELEQHGDDTDRYRKLQTELDGYSLITNAYQEMQVKKMMQEHKKFSGSSTDCSHAARESLYAMLCMLANTALKQDPTLALEQHMALTVHSHQYTRSAEMQDFMDYMREGISQETIDANTRESTPEEIRNWNPLEVQMEGIQELLDAYRNGESLNSGWPYYDRWEGTKLLKVGLENAQSIRRAWDYDAIWKLHNQCPEAVHFILAAPQAEFLLGKDGVREPITENLQHFLNSPWMEMAGNLDLAVSPQLLAATRRILEIQPLRQPSEMAFAR